MQRGAGKRQRERRSGRQRGSQRWESLAQHCPPPSSTNAKSAVRASPCSPELLTTTPANIQPLRPLRLSGSRATARDGSFKGASRSAGTSESPEEGLPVRRRDAAAKSTKGEGRNSIGGSPQIILDPENTENVTELFLGLIAHSASYSTAGSPGRRCVAGGSRWLRKPVGHTFRIQPRLVEAGVRLRGGGVCTQGSDA